MSRHAVPSLRQSRYSSTPHAAGCGCAPRAPMADAFLRNRRLPTPRSCWTERMSHRYTPPSCPWPCTAALVLHRYTTDTRLSLPKTRTDTRPTCAYDGRFSGPYTPEWREPSPKSPPLRRSGSNDRKAGDAFHARRSATPGLDSRDEKEKERGKNRPNRTRIRRCTHC